MTARRSITPAQRRKVLAASDGRCYLCGGTINLARINRGEEPPFEVDHVHARALGGGEDWLNLRAAHAECHQRKTRDWDMRGVHKIRRAEAEEKPKQKIASRGFDTRFKRKVGGAVEVRVDKPDERRSTS